MPATSKTPVPTLLVFMLGRAGIESGDSMREHVQQRRSELLAQIADTAPLGVEHYAVLPPGHALQAEAMDSSQAWADGWVEVARYDSVEALRAATEIALRLERYRAPHPAWSSHVYSAQAHAVRPLQPTAPLRKFTLGAALPHLTRRQWQDAWHAHGALIDKAPVFDRELKGYVQYHFLDAAPGGELGTPDAHAIAQTAWDSVEQMDRAYALPDYRAVLRTDEQNIIYKDRMIRVLATPISAAGL